MSASSSNEKIAAAAEPAAQRVEPSTNPGDPRIESEPGAARDRHGEYEPEQPMSVTGLVRRLIDDITTLFRKELALASSEVLHAVHDVRSGVTGVVSGAAMLYAGLVVLLGAAVLGLAEIMELWAAALVVGAAAALIGFIMMQFSKRKIAPRHFAPERTMDALREDRDMIGRQIR